MKNLLNPLEYLDAELAAEEKHEYVKGKLIPMAGGDYYHNKIKFEISMLLEQYFRSAGLNFEVLDSDMKTWFPAEHRFVYPDITVIATPPQFFVTPTGTIRRDAITNPVLVVEVLSNETRDYDKGEKFERYCTLPAFREYVLVEPGYAWVKTIFIEDRTEGLLRTRTVTDLSEKIFLHALGFELPVSDIYQAVKTNSDWPLKIL